jgi:DNA-binding protein WhiA
MSFSQEAKAEILQNARLDGCCETAFLSACFHTGGSIGLSNAGVGLSASSENSKFIRRIYTALKNLFGISAEIESQIQNVDKSRLYTITLAAPDAQNVLRQCKILQSDTGLTRINEGAPKELLNSDCCKIAYLTGAFLACGTVGLPAPEKNNGYHLEFVLSGETLADDVIKILRHFAFSFNPKKTTRKGNYVVYLKESDAIGNLLALLKASNAVLKLQALKIDRGLRNYVNRQKNCDEANIDKSLDTIARQLTAINFLNENGGLGTLSPRLRELADLRLKHREESTGELAAFLRPPLSKSGINHRFNKIIKIADELKIKEADNDKKRG